MRTFSRTNQFKKDVKRAEKRGQELAKLRAVLDLLIEGEPLPSEYRDHPLRGDFAGSRDCHIEPDWLLIYTLPYSHSPDYPSLCSLRSLAAISVPTLNPPSDFEPLICADLR